MLAGVIQRFGWGWRIWLQATHMAFGPGRVGSLSVLTRGRWPSRAGETACVEEVGAFLTYLWGYQPSLLLCDIQERQVTGTAHSPGLRLPENSDIFYNQSKQ